MTKIIFKKRIALLLAAAMMFAMIPTITYAAGPEENPTLDIGNGPVYLQENGGNRQYSSSTYGDWTDYTGTCTISGNTTNGSIIVMSGSHTIKLKDVSISLDNPEAVALEIRDTAGDITVELEGTNILKSGANRAGIEKNSNDSKSLTITSAAGDGKSDGSLEAISTDGAGIGGRRGNNGQRGTARVPSTPGENGGNGNNIIINGGTITARSTNGAGIGGGTGGDGGKGLEEASASGGTGGSGNNIIVYGGTITATSTNSAGIGGGTGGKGGDGGEHSAGNGGTGGNGSFVHIYGGTITVTGGSAGIGGGTGGTKGEGDPVLASPDGNEGSAGTQRNNEIKATTICKANAWKGESGSVANGFLIDQTTPYTIQDTDIDKYMKIVMEATGAMPPSLSEYWIDAAALKEFNLSSSAKKIGKIKFGLENGKRRAWAICGTDGTDKSELVLLSTSAFATGAYGTSSEYSKSNFVTGMDAYLSTTYFSDKELEKMAAVTVSTNEPNGSGGNTPVSVENKKLYLPNSYDQDSFGPIDTTIYVGSGNNIEIDVKKLTSANGFQQTDFWLRSPCSGDVHRALVATPGIGVSSYIVGDATVAAVPAFHLNLASVLFASAADAKRTDGFTPSKSMTENTYTLRYKSVGSESAVISTRGDEVTVTNAKGKYLMVQNNTGVYAKSIASNDPQTIKASDFTGGSALDNFDNYKVWIESTETDRITTAKMAKKEFKAKALWVSKHENTYVTFNWTGTPDNNLATAWEVQYRTKMIGTKYAWSKWTSSRESGKTLSKRIYLKPNYTIEFKVKHETDTAYLRSVFTTPAGGKYQSVTQCQIKVVATASGALYRQGTKTLVLKPGVNFSGDTGNTIYIKKGTAIKITPNHVYPRANFSKYPRLYPNHAWYDVADKSIVSLSGLSSTAGMMDSAVTLKGLKVGTTTIKITSCNGRGATLTIVVK